MNNYDYDFDADEKILNTIRKAREDERQKVAKEIFNDLNKLLEEELLMSEIDDKEYIRIKQKYLTQNLITSGVQRDSSEPRKISKDLEYPAKAVNGLDNSVESPALILDEIKSKDLNYKFYKEEVLQLVQKTIEIKNAELRNKLNIATYKLPLSEDEKKWIDWFYKILEEEE